MLTLVFISAAVILLLAGVMLLALGLRGRRIDDHPICRKCRFDLVGIYPAQERCPECGSLLAGAKAVRQGARRKRKGLVIAAIPLLLLGLGGGGALGWSSATSYNWYAASPDWLLEAVAGLDDPAKQWNAVGELTTRLATGRLDGERADRLIARGLEIQADQTQTWVRTWGDLIQAGLVADRLSREQFESYVTHSLRGVLSVRERVRTQESTTIGIQAVADRFGSGTMVRVDVSWPRFVADGTEISPAKTNSGGGFMFRGSGAASSSRPVMIALAPGRYTLVCEPVLRVSLTGTSAQVAVEPVVIAWELSSEFEVVPPGTVLVELIDDPSIGPAMAAAIGVPQLKVVSEGEGFTSIDAQVRGRDLPMDFAFDFLIRDADGNLQLWTRMSFSAGSQQSQGAENQIDARLGETADVVLRASEEALLMRSDLESAWGGEIVIEDVPVVRPKSEEE